MVLFDFGGRPKNRQIKYVFIHESSSSSQAMLDIAPVLQKPLSFLEITIILMHYCIKSVPYVKYM